MDAILRTFLLSWTWRPDIIVVVATLGTLYVAGWWHLWRQRARVVRKRQLALYLAAPPAICLAVLCPLDIFGSFLFLMFLMHMVQHGRLVMVAPALLVLCDSLPPVLRALPQRPRRAVRPSARSLALIVLVVVSAAGTSTAAATAEVPAPERPPSLPMDDPAADAALLEGKWEEAIRLHRDLIARDPVNGRTHYHLGYAYGQLEMYAEEIAAYREAIRLGVRESLLFYNLGLALATVRQDYDGAIAALRGGLELDPNDPELWYNLGVAYLSKREFAQARDAFAAAIQRDPDHLDARNNLGHALVGLGDLKAARAEWEALLARSPGNPLAMYNLRSLEEQERRGAAEE